MGIKQTIRGDHIPVNKYKLIIDGIGFPIIFTKVSGLETMIDVVDLPDRTRASGGNTQATEIKVEQPLHLKEQVALMEAWFIENQDPIGAAAKRAATLVMESGRGIPTSYILSGVWPSGRKLPDLDYESEGEMAVIEWTLQVDDTVAPPA